MKNKKDRVQQTNRSLSARLNFRLWRRMFSKFVLLNVVFLVVCAFMLFLVGEQKAVDTIYHLEKEGFPSDMTMAWMRSQGIEIRQNFIFFEGFKVPKPLAPFFPKETRSLARSINLAWDEKPQLYNYFDNLQYQFHSSANSLNYTMVIHLSDFLRVIKPIFLSLLIFQILILIRSWGIQRGIITRSLSRSLSKLTEQAESLSREQGPLSVKEMQSLAGTLDEINAARLDTRIDLDSTQEELQNLAQAINGLLERINESYRLQARFVSDASHELRTPIAAIQGYANLLDRWGKDDPEALDESIGAIKEEAANMKELVEQLLFLARGDNNSMQLDLQLFDAGALMQTIHQETLMINGAYDLHLHVEDAWINADQGLIKQAGRILVDNAIKYTSAEGKITLAVRKEHKKVWLTVQDSGIGIPPEDIPHIFERFYRADESRARVSGGTGLGLSIAKWIVERHGGYLEVLSREDFGTKISLVLPEAKQP